MREVMKAGRLREAGLMILIAAVYVVGAKLGLRMAYVAQQVTVVWPPTGIALCAILIFGSRVWPAIAIGAFIANITTDPSLFTAAGISAGNTLEALTGAYLLNQFVGFKGTMQRFRDVFGLIVFAAVASTAVSATIGVLTLCLKAEQPWSQFGAVWFVWWLGDAMGVLIMVPLVMTWSERIRNRFVPGIAMEFWLFVAVLSAADWVVFTYEMRSPGFHPPVYVVFPFLIWAALRFGPRGTALATYISAWIAIAGTLHGYGPFASGTVSENLVSLQIFMWIFAGTGLVLAASQGEREALQLRQIDDQKQMRDHERSLRESAEALAIDNERLFQEANESSSRKDEFLAMLAHELRNPLAPIRNALQVMQLLPEDKEKAKWAQDIMRRQVGHMARLLDDLLDVSRITRGKIQLDRQPLDLGMMVRHSVDAVRPMLDSRPVQLAAFVPSEPLIVSADSLRLEQIIANLLSNAIKFTDSGEIVVVLEQQEDQAVLKVRDTGVGISREILPRVFELFFQTPRSLSRSEGGLGIGLTLVRSLVVMHGGAILAFSDGPGCGSEFVVRIPLVQLSSNEGRISAS